MFGNGSDIDTTSSFRTGHNPRRVRFWMRLAWHLQCTPQAMSLEDTLAHEALAEPGDDDLCVDTDNTSSPSAGTDSVGGSHIDADSPCIGTGSDGSPNVNAGIPCVGVPYIGIPCACIPYLDVPCVGADGQYGSTNIPYVCTGSLWGSTGGPYTGTGDPTMGVSTLLGTHPQPVQINGVGGWGWARATCCENWRLLKRTKNKKGKNKAKEHAKTTTRHYTIHTTHSVKQSTFLNPPSPHLQSKVKNGP